MQSKVVGIDIGGANLKPRSGKMNSGSSRSGQFSDVAKAPRTCDRHARAPAPTGRRPGIAFRSGRYMTGEWRLFPVAHSGVREILAQLSQVCSADRIFVTRLMASG